MTGVEDAIERIADATREDVSLAFNYRTHSFLLRVGPVVVSDQTLQEVIDRALQRLGLEEMVGQ